MMQSNVYMMGDNHSNMVEESPTMSTPYLETSLDTPYLDGSVTTPYFDNGSDSFLMSSYDTVMNYMHTMSYKDICIVNYLQQETYHDPIATFNGDPTQLLIDKTKTAEDSNSLFPPLLSDSESYGHDSTSMNEFKDISLDEILGFDSTSPQLPEEPTEIPTHTMNRRKSKDKKSKEKQYKCPLCPLISKRRYNLTTHMKTHDRNRIKEFPCSQCHKCFDRRHDRDRHLATVHRGERSYACDHCSTNFSRRDGLIKHLIQKHHYEEDDLIH